MYQFSMHICALGTPFSHNFALAESLSRSESRQFYITSTSTSIILKSQLCRLYFVRWNEEFYEKPHKN